MPKYDKETNLNAGLPEHDGLDEVGRQEILNRLEPRVPGIVGNYADLQRGGASDEITVAAEPKATKKK